MNALVRLTVLFVATISSIVVFSCLFETFNALPDFLSNLSEGSTDRRASDFLFPLASVFWGALFRAPLYVLWGTVPLLLVFIALEFRAKPGRWIYLAIWVFAGLLTQGPFLQMISRALAAILAGLIAGQVFWLLAGRRAGLWRQEPKGAISEKLTRIFGGFRHWNLVAYAIVAFLAYQLSGPIIYAGKMVWVSFISEPDLGATPYTYLQKRDFTVHHKIALLKFPDANSCLVDGIDDLSPENLKKMDWTKIENSEEAEVCGFRLLGSNPDISYATDWFLAQGMTISDQMSSAKPHKETNGNLRVNAGWSISENGYKFAPPGPLLRLITLIPPYTMTVNATWSPDGQRLVNFDIGFLRL